MPCTRPIPAWQPLSEKILGTNQLKFQPPRLAHDLLYKKIQISCNKCIGCKQVSAVKTAIQLYCELNQSKDWQNWFITYTFDDEHLPENMSVDLRDMQLLNKRIRKHLSDNEIEHDFRFLQQGEIGGQFARPHYHQCVFNLPLADLKIYNIKNEGTQHEYKQFESSLLTKLWGKGNVIIQELTYGNCLYVAQHHLKEKIDPDHDDGSKMILHPITAKVIIERTIEVRSRSNGIGRKFYEEFFSDIFPGDFMVVQGQKYPVPRYFLDKLQKDNLELYEELKEIRSSKIVKKTDEQNAYQEQFYIHKIRSGR